MRKGADNPERIHCRLALDRLAKAGLDRGEMQGWRAVVAEARRLDGPEAKQRMNDPGWVLMRKQRRLAAEAWRNLPSALKALAEADPLWAKRLERGAEREAWLLRLPALARKEAERWGRLGKKPEGGQPKLAPALLAEIYRAAMEKSGGRVKLSDLAALLEVTTAQMKHAKTGKSLAMVPLVSSGSARIGTPPAKK